MKDPPSIFPYFSRILHVLYQRRIFGKDIFISNPIFLKNCYITISAKDSAYMILIYNHSSFSFKEFQNKPRKNDSSKKIAKKDSQSRQKIAELSTWNDPDLKSSQVFDFLQRPSMMPTAIFENYITSNNSKFYNCKRTG